MIRTFGGGDLHRKKQVESSNKYGMSEELRDEHFNQKLMEAFDLKNRGAKDQEALELYLNVLSQEFLKDSIVEKHVFMRFNALKNSGELYERLGHFKSAKEHFTQALKIKEKEPFIWTRLGFIEYDHFKDMKLAKACFQAAAQTCTAIERRSSMINILLFKLAEIHFQEFDFKASEQMTDALLARLDPRAPNPQAMPNFAHVHEKEHGLFAYQMKIFFLQLRNDVHTAQLYEKRAQNIKPNAQLGDLEIFKRFKLQMSENLALRKDQGGLSVVWDRQGTQLVPLDDKAQETHKVIDIVPQRSDYTSFIDCFDDFLLNLAQTCERYPRDQLLVSHLSFPDYVKLLSQILSVTASTAAASSHQPSAEQLPLLHLRQEQDYWGRLRGLDGQLNHVIGSATSGTGHAGDAVMGGASTGEANPGGAQAVKGRKKQEGNAANTQRTLRRKPDSIETQIKQYNLSQLRDYLDFTIERNYGAHNIGTPSLDDAFSTREILNAKQFFEKSAQDDSVMQQNSMNQDSLLGAAQDTPQAAAQRVPIYHTLHQALAHLNNKSAMYILRGLLSHLIAQLPSLNFSLASHLYRLFAVLLSGNFSRASLDLALPSTAHAAKYRSLLALFEVALFNKQAIKEVKSSALIIHREKMFEYFVHKELEIIHSIENTPGASKEELEDAQRVKSRMFYAMMYYAFEIKNNMHASISYYQKLQNGGLGSQKFPIVMPWVSMLFVIDEAKVAEYGGVKLNKAQVFKANDEELIQLKMLEIEESKRACALKQKLAPSLKVKGAFVKFACFYLDQLCTFLQKTVTIQDSMGGGGGPAQNMSASDSANFGTNEEKIKEMWGKLLFSMCRCPTAKMLKLMNSLFSILTAFQYFNKTFYEQFILKKLEMEPIFTELKDRFKTIYQEVLVERAREVAGKGRLQIIREELVKRLGVEVVEQGAEANSISQIIRNLAKTQVNLLRVMTCEFLFHHIINNIQNLNQGQILLQNYFQDLFYIEAFLCILRMPAKEDDSLIDLQDSLRSLIVLIKRLDKLSCKNNDVFVRAYFKLHVTALPLMTSLFASQQQQQQSQARDLDESNDFFQLIVQTTGYFFDIKYNQTDMQPGGSASVQDRLMKPSKPVDKEESKEEGQQDDDEEGSDTDEKKKYTLKCLLKMKDKSSKYWAVTLNQLMPSNLNVGSQAGGPNQQTGCMGNPQLYYIYSAIQMVDAQMLRDVCTIVNSVAKGRFLAFGEMNIKDISNVALFVDLIAKYLIDNQKMLNQYQNKGFSFLERAELFKLCTNQSLSNHLLQQTSPQLQTMTNTPLTFLTQFSHLPPLQCSFEQSIGSIAFFALNLSSHLALDSTSVQQITEKVNAQKRKRLLDTSLSTLQGQGNKFIKNLRTISVVDLAYSSYGVESLLLQAQVQGELWMQANNCKLASDYKKQNSYLSFRDRYHHTLNTILIALQQLFAALRGDIQLSQERWANLNTIQKLKQAFSLALYMVATKAQGCQFVLERGNSWANASVVKQQQVQSQAEFLEKKAQKVKNLKDLAYILAVICEKLEKLLVVSEDPRLASGKSNEIQTVVLSILENFLAFIQRSTHGTFSDRIRFQIPQDCIEDCLFKINHATSDYNKRMEAIQLKTSFEYPYLQALLRPFSQDDFSDLVQMNHILKVAYVNRSSKGCLEAFIDVLRRALHLSIDLRYEAGSPDERKLALQQSVLKYLVTERKQIFKLILGANNPQQQANKAGGLSKQEKELNDFVDIDKEPEEDDIGLNPDLIDANISASLARVAIFRQDDDMPEYNQFESALDSLYRAGDQLYQILQSQSLYLWARIRLQHVLVKELQYEITLNPIAQAAKGSELAMGERLGDLLTQAMQNLQTHEDSLQDSASPSMANYFADDSNGKNIVSMWRHTDLALSELRITVKTFYIELNSRYFKYEPIKEQYKRNLHIAKQVEKQTLNPASSSGGALLAGSGGGGQGVPKTVELNQLFTLSKDKYLETLYHRIRKNLELYLQIRRRLKVAENNPKEKPETLVKLRQSYRELRDKISVSKDHMPAALRDIFDLLIETHAKRSLLTAKNLIDDMQKRQIRQAVLLCCAFCGPDSEFESNKISGSFLDLERIVGDDEYESEGLIIGIKWYMGILDDRSAKKDGDTIKKLKAIVDDFEKAIKEQQALMRAQLQAFPPVNPQATSSLLDEQVETNLARQLFQNADQ